MPRRWTDLDTDAHRLPSGFTRTGYDSNTRRYHFTDAEGRMYRGEPGEEFGGRLSPINPIDPSMKHRFASDDNEVGEDAVESPLNSPEPGGPQPVFTPTEQKILRVPPTPSSFSDFLSSSQVATAAPPKPPQKNSSNRSSTFSLKRATASIMAFRSTKSKGKASTLPNLPPTRVDEWGIVQSPRTTKF